MATTASRRPLLPPGVVDLRGELVGQRADGATVAAIYTAVLLLTPAALIVRGLPLSITPAALIGLGALVLWMCAHLTTTLGAAKGWNVARTALLLFLVSNLVSYGYASAGYLPRDELNLADHAIALVLANLGIGLLVCDGVRGFARLDLVLKVAVVAGALISVIGAIQFLTGFDLTRYMTAPGLRLSYDDVYVLERGSVRRVAATTAHPIEFGVVCAMLLPLGVHYARMAALRGQPRLRWWLCTGLIAVGLMFSVSRSAVLSMVAIGAVLLAGWPRRLRWQALGVLLGFLAFIRVFVPGLLGTFYDLFANFFNDNSVTGRTHDYSTALREIQQHLLLGRGTGTWYVPKYEVFDNQYVQVTIDTGVIGLVIFLGMMVCAVFVALAARRRSSDPQVRDLGLTLAACMVAPIISSATFDFLSFATVAGLMFVLVGAAGSLLRSVRANPCTAAGPRSS
ncbi:O-antigen ligase family protein [Nonomuraea sp. NPDC005983]|uniref:O-antigen ligase family protein n=1 Tax=Nonomuraea sp. NPDC005983 TaxID=3155595 RepID=UPI0033A501CD